MTELFFSETMVDQILIYIEQHIAMAPYVIFFLFCLAGLNIPVSEDGLIFAAAMVAAKHPDMLVIIYLSVLVGAFTSDTIAYWVGRLVGPKLFEIKFFSKMVSKERFDQISRFYARFGITTLIFGRFIPFGVRNALFMTAGIGRMRFSIFLLADFLACFMTTGLYFYLFYTYGEGMLRQVQNIGLGLFGVIILSFVLILWKRRRNKTISA